jgi:hypothetical protein
MYTQILGIFRETKTVRDIGLNISLKHCDLYLQWYSLYMEIQGNWILCKVSYYIFLRGPQKITCNF